MFLTEMYILCTYGFYSCLKLVAKPLDLSQTIPLVMTCYLGRLHSGAS